MNRLIMTFMFGALVLSLTAAEVSAQQWQLLATFEGQPASGYVPPLGTGKLDFDGDGVPDLPYFETDSQGNVFLIIQDGADPTNLYSLPEIDDEDMITFAKATVIGYFELDGSNTLKEIVLAEKKGQRFIHPVVLDVNGTVLWDGSGTILLTVANMEADVDAEEEEVVVYNPAMTRVEVWGN